ncbi:RRQRL motif-containing zinc-binding protein [Streptomyces sp. NRRL S-118]|uniref:RRQRL motif-containing zinc-binding protein n=1 Tax=Streptomyces sp. NRRL S-118 TaxID=1463881 RepID=UPI0004CBF721|nr:RRQRL motif-containing zinc-binding protein [Streptomyces sp. NRRL S-118]
MAARRRLYDPTGERYGIPTFPWRMAPDGLATRRQLRARGLRLWYSRRYWCKGTSPIRVAYLYRLDLAKPVRPMTPAKWAVLAKANAAQRVCPECRRDAGYRIPTSLGMCVSCADAPQVAA